MDTICIYGGKKLGFSLTKKLGPKKKAWTDNKDNLPPRRFVRFVNTGYFIVKKIFYNSDFKALRRIDAFMFFIFMSYHFLANCSREGWAQDKTAFTTRLPFTSNRADASQRCYKIYGTGRVIIHDPVLCTTYDGENRCRTPRIHWTIVPVWFRFYFYSILLRIKSFRYKCANPLPSHTQSTYKPNLTDIRKYGCWLLLHIFFYSKICLELYRFYDKRAATS